MIINFFKKTKINPLISILFFGLFFISTPIAYAELIRSFSSTINVLPDSSILVKEKITYDFEKALRHGISRNISLLNSKNEMIKIEVVSILDEINNVYKFTTDSTNGLFTITIGDPDRMISGIKEFNITYQVWGSITYFDDFDELYWNATGNDWQVHILKSEATVVLPNNVFPIKQSCYYGVIGSTAQCKINEFGVFYSDKELNEKEGLTIAVGFPKGIVANYENTIKPNDSNPIRVYWPIFIPLLIFIYKYTNWFKKGRDEKGDGVIVPQYDVLDNLTPLEVSGIVNGKIVNQNIAAEIIYLATKGFIKIKHIDEECDNFLCLITKKDYEFTLLKEIGLAPNIFDRKILNAIFEEGGRTGGVSKISELDNNFYKSILSIDNAVIDSLLNKKYFINFPKFKNKEHIVFGSSIFGVTLFAGKFFNITSSPDEFLRITILVSSLIISIMIYLIFERVMSARSHKGASAREYFLGLKEYLQIAEKDRLNFHNAPDKKPETFEVLLPYAMVFGVEELWAKEFEGIYNDKPKWYQDKTSSFDVVNFGHEMTLFNKLAALSVVSNKNSSSGSGGGGMSGGGGGGGGGRSW